MMNILQVQDALKGASDQQLLSEVKSPTGMAPQYLVMSELKRRQDMRAKAVQPPTSTVAEDIEKKAEPKPMGITALRSPMQGAIGTQAMPQAAQGQMPVSEAPIAPEGYAEGGLLYKHGMPWIKDENGNLVPNPPTPGYPSMQWDIQPPQPPVVKSISEDMPGYYSLPEGPPSPSITGYRGGYGNNQGWGSGLIDKIKGAVKSGPSAPADSGPSQFDSDFYSAPPQPSASLKGQFANAPELRQAIPGAPSGPSQFDSDFYTSDPAVPQNGSNLAAAQKKTAEKAISDAAASASLNERITALGLRPGSSLFGNAVAVDPQTGKPYTAKQVNSAYEMLNPQKSGDAPPVYPVARPAQEANTSASSPSEKKGTSPSASGSQPSGIAALGSAKQANDDAPVPAQQTQKPGESYEDFLKRVRAGGEDKLSPYEEKIANMEKDIKGRSEQNAYMALMRAGLGMANSRNPTLLGAIGEAGIPALNDYQAAQSEQRKELTGLLGAQANIATARQHTSDSQQNLAGTLHNAAQNNALQQAQLAESTRHNMAAERISQQNADATGGYYKSLSDGSAKDSAMYKLASPIAGRLKLLDAQLKDMTLTADQKALVEAEKAKLQANFDAIMAGAIGPSAVVGGVSVPAIDPLTAAMKARGLLPNK